MLTNQFYRYLAEQIKSGSQGRDSFYIAVGEGEQAWDTQVVQSKRTVSSLVNEIFRKPVPAEMIAYVDEAGQATQQSSSILRFQIQLEIGEGSGTLRECGLFAGQATAAVGSGTLLSHFIHPAIEKNVDAVLARIITLDLSPHSTLLAGHQSRYLGNAISEELHDLENEKGNCQIDELRIDRRTYFSSPQQALALGYDYCGHCFGKVLSTR